MNLYVIFPSFSPGRLITVITGVSLRAISKGIMEKCNLLRLEIIQGPIGGPMVQNVIRAWEGCFTSRSAQRGG